MLVEYEREAYAREAIGRARAGMSAIDAELRSSITTLKALATSKNLESGDIQRIPRRIRARPGEPASLAEYRAVDRDAGAIERREPAMERISTEGNYDETFELAVGTREPTVGNLREGTAVTEPTIRIRVPVIIKGDVRYVLSVPIVPSSFQSSC